MTKIPSQARLQLEQIMAAARTGMPIDPEDMLRAMAMARHSRELVESIAAHQPLRYQVSRQHPGCLEQIDADGTVRIGHFIEGRFRPLE